MGDLYTGPINQAVEDIKNDEQIQTALKTDIISSAFVIAYDAGPGNQPKSQEELEDDKFFKKNRHEDNFRMPVIVIEKNGKYQDFYYNSSDGIWKLLSENYDHMTFQDWWDEEEVAMPRAKVPNFLFATEAVGSSKIFEGSEFEQIEIDY